MRSTTPANTLDVNATGEAGIDLDNTSGTLAKTTDITGFNDISAADVNTQVSDVMKTDTLTEPGQVAPPVAASMELKIAYVYKFLRNKITNDGSDIEVYNDDGSTVGQTAPVSEAAGKVTRGEFVAGV